MHSFSFFLFFWIQFRVFVLHQMVLHDRFLIHFASSFSFSFLKLKIIITYLKKKIFSAKSRVRLTPSIFIGFTKYALCGTTEKGFLFYFYQSTSKTTVRLFIYKEPLLLVATIRTRLMLKWRKGKNLHIAVFFSFLFLSLVEHRAWENWLWPCKSIFLQSIRKG